MLHELAALARTRILELGLKSPALQLRQLLVRRQDAKRGLGGTQASARIGVRSKVSCWAGGISCLAA